MTDLGSYTPATLGERYSLLTHAVLFGSDLLCEGVFVQTFRVRDERTELYEATAAVVRAQATEIKAIGGSVAHFDGADRSAFLAGVHADNLVRLERSWDSAHYRLNWPDQPIPAKATRELVREARCRRSLSTSAIGENYADLTYWAVGALRELGVSSQFPRRHKHNEERTLRYDIRTAKELVRAVRDTGTELNSMAASKSAVVVRDFDAKTRLRMRLSADDVVGRLRPVYPQQEGVRPPMADTAPFSDLWDTGYRGDVPDLRTISI